MSKANQKHDNYNKITEGMSDVQRYEMLKNRNISIVRYRHNELMKINLSEYNELEKAGKSRAFQILRKTGESYGIFRQDYTTQDVMFEFAFSRTNLQESVNKQLGEFQNYAKMMTVFYDVIKNAVCIDAHSERYDNPGSRLDLLFVFVSAFDNDEGIVPVMLDVKTFTDKTVPALHVAVSLRAIARSRIVGHIPDAKGIKSYPLPASDTANISNLLSNVNKIDKNMLKYIPDGFLDGSRRETKEIALSETAEYIKRKDARRAERKSSKT